MKYFSTQKLAIISLSLIGVVALLTTSLLKHKPDTRAQYEQFLQQEKEKIPVYTEEQIKEMPKPTHPDKAAIQNYFMTVDPKEKRVPIERLREAYKETRKASQNKSFISPFEWDFVPSNMGGRCRAVMYDPNDSNKLWAGAVTGGLWYNNNISDANSPWVQVDDFWASLSISFIVADPNDPNTFYVGTGEAQTAFKIYRESSTVGVGIFKSTDAGQTWELMPSTEDFKYVNDMVIRTEGGESVLYAGVVSGLYRGIVHESLPSEGLYRSIDEGESWEQVLPNIEGTETPYAVADLELGADETIYVGTMRNLDDEGGATVLISDDGTVDSWDIYDDHKYIIEDDPERNIPGRVMLAAAPSDEDVVYAVIGAGFLNEDEYNMVTSEGRHIIKSTDKGDSWEALPIPTGGQYFWASIGWHALTAIVDPFIEDEIYIAGLDTYKSLNGGENWHKVSNWTGMYGGDPDVYVHGDIHKFAYKPGSNTEMVVVTDGGVFYTNSADQYTPIWDNRNNNFGTLQFYTCDLHPAPGFTNYIGGLQDNGTVYTFEQNDTIDLTNAVSGGDGAFCFIDSDNPGIIISSIYYNRYYVFSNGSQDMVNGAYGSGTFINPADYDNRENTLYANATTFLGANQNVLLKISNIPTTNDIEGVVITSDVVTPFSNILVSKFAPEGTSTLFVGTESGRLFKVENAQGTPETTEIGASNFPTAYLSCVAEGGSEDTLLATFSNYGVSSVWQTYDGGINWNEIEGNLPDIPIRWAIYHPENANQAMLATELGVWYSDDLTVADPTWIPVGPANVRVDMLQIRPLDNTVLAATHGRGLATTTFEQLYTGINNNETLSIDMKVYPNPATEKLNIVLDANNQNVELSIMDMSGRMVYSNTYTANESSHMTVDVSSFAAGQYVVNARINNQIKTKKLIIN